MSALAPERARPAPARKPTPTPPRLHLITRSSPEARARRAPKTPFVILLLVLLAGGLLGLLLLNTVIDQDAFTLHDLQSKQTALDVAEAQLHEQANSNADPAALAAKATALGMIPAGTPTFLKAAKLPKGGTLVGNLYIVSGTPAPTPASTTATTAAVATHAAVMSTAAPVTKPVASAAPTVTHAAATPTHAAVTRTHAATVTRRASAKTSTTGRP